MSIHSHLPYDQSISHARIPARGINLIASIDSVSEAQVTASFFGSTKSLHGEVATTTAETTTHNHSNQQYSITAVTTSAGAIAERYAYSAYGEPTILDGSGSAIGSSSINNRYSYTGREWDATVGLYHFRARWMSPKTRRFIGRDPIGYFDGPDLFAYLGNNPLDYTDPSGFAGDEPGTTGVCKDGAPKPKVTVNFTSKLNYKTEAWRKTVSQMRNLVGGVTLGRTEPDFTSNSRPMWGSEPCKNCMCEGGFAILLYLKEFELNLHLDITVTTVDWVNVPRSKQREWERLKQAILDHENRHVRDMQGVYNDAKNGKKPSIEPMSRLVCPKDLLSAKKELQDAVKAKEIELRDKVGNWVSERYRKLRDQFHQTNPNIDPRDYISE